MEVIVIDDGSTDNTLSVLHTYSDKITILSQARGGPYRARNLGAKHAKGDWLAFLDADDDWMSDKLTKQLAASGEDIAMVYTDRLNFGDLSKVAELQSDSVEQYEGDIFEPLLHDNFVTFSSVMLRKSWFEKLDGFSVAQHGVQDWDMWLRLSAAGGKVKLIREPLTRYRFHAAQMSKHSAQRAADRMAVLERALATPRGQSVSHAVRRKAYAGLSNLAASDASADGQRLAALSHWLASARYWPWNVQVYKQIVKTMIGRA